MRKYLVKGYMIVHGQKIQLIQDIYCGKTVSAATITTKNKLKEAFEKAGNIVEFDNCIFEKEACSGIFAEVEDVGPEFSLFPRIWHQIKDRWPLQWKYGFWKQEY